jgi:hypothetical protein
MMAKNIRRYQRDYEKEHPEDSVMISKLGIQYHHVYSLMFYIDFIPSTYSLPSDYHMFVEEYKK